MKFFFILMVYCVCAFANGDEYNDFNSEQNDPLKQTQQLLRSAKERQVVIESSQNAKQADEYARQVVGEQNKEEVYDISASLMAWLMQQAQDNPDKANEILLKAQSDPVQFYRSIPQSERDRIRNLSQKVPKPNQP